MYFLVSKKKVVLHRWESGNEHLVLLTELMRFYGHCKEIQELTL